MNFINYDVLSKEKKGMIEYFILKNQHNKKYLAKIVNEYDKEILKIFANEVNKCQYIIKNDKSINIPNIISYGSNYIIYEYIDGISLTQLKKIELNKLLMIYLRICYQVKKIHSLNLVHGDLKLSNILLKDNDVYIVDYGACTFIGENIKYGSKIYCSIGQLMKEPATFKFDIYALGVILYALIENKLPYFNFSNTKELILEKKHSFPILKNTNIDYFNRINDLIQKMTMENINIDEVIKELKQIIIGVD